MNRKNPDKARLSAHQEIAATIRTIPRGTVSTYGAIARAAGFPGAARQVAQVLRRSYGLPWQRVLGSGGEIKLRGDSAIEQRLRLEAEGVGFRGRKVNMRLHEFQFSTSKRTKAEPAKPKRQKPRAKSQRPNANDQRPKANDRFPKAHP